MNYCLRTSVCGHLTSEKRNFTTDCIWLSKLQQSYSCI